MMGIEVSMHRFHRTALAGAVPLALAVFVLGQEPGLSARQEQLPAGRDVISRYIEAIGGEAAFAALQSIRATGTLEIVSAGISGSVEVLAARPAKVRVNSQVPGVGELMRGYDGTVGWSMDPIAGPALIVERELRELIDDAQFDGPLHPTSHVNEITTIERTEFDGRPAYKLQVVFVSGTDQFEYFDVETGLMLGQEGTRAMPMGNVPRTAIMRDYQAFGDLLQPTALVQQLMGIEQVVRLTSYEYNTVQDDAFVPPAEVRALIKD
jgi:hypothetical protein